jgi:hypothetical protein
MPLLVNSDRKVQLVPTVMRSATRPADELVISTAPFTSVRFVRVINCELDHVLPNRRMSTTDTKLDAVHSVDVTMSDCDDNDSNEDTLLLFTSKEPMVAWEIRCTWLFTSLSVCSARLPLPLAGSRT